ncbi:hypothetical protein E3E12_00635 [Formicincola oecophyllae]|uniref:Outer membrane lipoprotein carrier protein LolA n=1 Tax=Formicincola oecophyllae TaxID=2558361 RepID=A0A4Y6U6I0_9PROT|nr:hypothetical protein [Formicincola oecophyllae]QDH12952.1 hypothetical protein E3E12_00635 [Formicincola oecophyllae]
MGSTTPKKGRHTSPQALFGMGLALAIATVVGLGLGGCASGGLENLAPLQRQELASAQGAFGAQKPFTAPFRQEGPGQGQVASGKMTYAPGHLRLDYTSPAGQVLLADEGRILLIGADGSRTRMGLGRSPLGRVLAQPVDFTRGTQVTNITTNPGWLQISLADALHPSDGLVTLGFKRTPGKGGLDFTSLEAVDGRSHDLRVELGPKTPFAPGTAPAPALFESP